MNVKKIRLGLIGKDVSKSQSERIHAFILKEFGVECVYESFSVPPTEFDNVIRRLMGDFDGFNVTIPYKRDVMEYLDEVVGDAFLYGAVNTVITAGAKGYNTDGIGFLQALEDNDIAVKDKKVLILGGGGAGRSCAAALKYAGAYVHMYQRRKEKLEETCRELGVTAANGAEDGGYDLLVNCTGVGMHDSEGISPVTSAAFAGAKWAIDLIYQPTQTEFLRLAKAQGLKTVNGAAMLFYQAYYADCLYLGIEPNKRQAAILYAKYNEVNKNGELL
jgi:shikimate dehydrogenase